FHHFVSRLGQICDARPGGHTVTAFTVIQRVDKIQYVFGSNRRKHAELESVKGFVGSILKTLHGAFMCENDEESEEMTDNLLRDVLLFNRDRVKRYLKGLNEALVACIDLCRKDNTSQVMACIEALIDQIHRILKPFQNMFLLKRASDEKSSNSVPWRELRHFSSRLLAYKRAAEDLMVAGNLWPELFIDVEVVCIPSSDRGSNPLMTGPQTTAEILNRLIPADTRDKYKELAIELQKSSVSSRQGIDEEIAAAWTKKSFRPIIHAELLVLNWLEVNGLTRPEYFFNNWRFIGCSKPTCKLCFYYISSHHTGIQFRNRHPNLYLNWRMPEVVNESGQQTKEQLQAKHTDIIQKIMDPLRQDIIRTLSEKVADRRDHDSSTYSFVNRNQAARKVATEPGVTSGPRSTNLPVGGRALSLPERPTEGGARIENDSFEGYGEEATHEREATSTE
ncbi:hypothetical protein GQ53DRAFT_889572, partial [Thozetella sp. PMI_491]